MTKLKYKTPVSIITISQLIRFECLLNLYELIKLQKYKNIIEWVIVEGSHSEEDGEKNKENINKLLQIHSENIGSKIKKMKIVYVEYTGLLLSDLRNLGNNKCSGDIIVCMDDDDYYPRERVSHAVDTLIKSSYLIAGCSSLYMYEYSMSKLYKFSRFHKNHSTNNCMAFKREYLLNHKHTEGLTMAEESSFTNNFTEPMVQLNPLKCTIASSHNMNTFNKRELCVMGSIGIHHYLNEANCSSITDYIPSERFTKMKNLFYKEEKSPYDIIYFCGGFGKKWNPTDDALDNPEKDLVCLCEIAANTGRKIAVYANIFENITYNNVDYKKWNLFEFNHQYNTVILWRSYGLICCLPYALKSKFTLFNVVYEDFTTNANAEHMYKVYNKYENKISRILFKK
jgi:glycosyltransferase involved in cell wall biosynthesis